MGSSCVVTGTEQVSASVQVLERRSGGVRLLQLDALRGLAAASVVLHHSRLAFQVAPTPWYLVPFVFGDSAVVLFFVLSGYVLSLPYWNGTRLPYVPYAVRRFCRVYLPYAAALLLALVGAWWFQGSPLRLTPWFNQTWHSPISWPLVTSQLKMRPTPELNTAFWSLRYEVEMSLAMPLLCLFLRKGNAVWITLLGAAAMCSVPVLPTALQAHYLDRTVAVAVLFAMGATLAKSPESVRRFVQGAGHWIWLFLAISLLCFWQYSTRWENLVSPQIQAHFDPFQRHRTELLSGLGALGLLACALHVRSFARLLTHPMLEYLGRISFSLYLVHGTVLFAALFLLSGRVPLPFLIGTVVVMSFAAAHLFCVGIEEPTIRFGKQLSRWIAGLDANPVSSQRSFQQAGSYPHMPDQKPLEEAA
ncbi:MAG: acyltransferase family protein [Janthinobacterium lividum]